MLKKLSKGDGDDEDEDEEDGEAAEKAEEKSEEKTTFEKFYDEFKMFLLLGCHEDDANRSKLAKLLRFVSSYTEGQSVKKLTSLEDLYLDEPYAELCFSKIFDFEGVKLRSIQKA